MRIKQLRQADLNLLVVFTVLAEERNASRAATRLFDRFGFRLKTKSRMTGAKSKIRNRAFRSRNPGALAARCFARSYAHATWKRQHVEETAPNCRVMVAIT